jgi:S-(hydroxymethyl)glutathione dehydrogenase/alcohol dehydrogenase
MTGTLKVDEYVTHQRKLEDINEGFNDMHVSCQIKVEVKNKLIM